MLLVYSLRYNLSSRLHRFSWVSPQLPERKNEAVLGPSVVGAQNLPESSNVVEKRPAFHETVAGPHKLLDPLRSIPTPHNLVG